MKLTDVNVKLEAKKVGSADIYLSPRLVVSAYMQLETNLARWTYPHLLFCYQQAELAMAVAATQHIQEQTDELKRCECKRWIVPHK